MLITLAKLSGQKTRVIRAENTASWDTQRHGHPYGQQCSFKYVYSSSDANYNNNFGYTSGQHRVRGRQNGESTEDLFATRQADGLDPEAFYK